MLRPKLSILIPVGRRGYQTGKESPGIVIGFMRQCADRPAIAIDKVRHYGEAVAAVAAIDEDIAEEALDLIEVDYEELTPVLNWEEAVKEGTPLVHENVKINIPVATHFEYGVDKTFKKCDFVRERSS